MKGWLLAWLFLVAAQACSPSDGSDLAPFYVDAASSVSPATGSICAPFLTLQAALSASLDLAAVVISLLSSATMEYGEVNNSLTLLGNFHSITLEDIIMVQKALVIQKATLISTTDTLYILGAFAPLSLHFCTMQGFISPAIIVQSQVTVTNSVFLDNARGVFYNLQQSGVLNVTDSKFVGNAALSGAVLYAYPVSAAGFMESLFLNCEFKANGNTKGNSVLLINDETVSYKKKTGKAVIFSKCLFQNSQSATFQLISKFSQVTIDNCQFEHEPQLLTGKTSDSNVTFSQISVKNCGGPLVAIAFGGMLQINSSNFTNIGLGPVIHVTGQGLAKSLVYMSETNVSDIANSGSSIYGNLINAVSATIWLHDVSVTGFRAAETGLFYLAQSVVYSQGLSFFNGSASQFVIGQLTASTVMMNATLFDGLQSRGSMALATASSVELREVTFRNILGSWDENMEVYTTNFFLFMLGSTELIDGLVAELVQPGSTLIYVYGGQCFLSNSHLTGPLGMGLFTILSGNVTVRTSSFSITAGRTFAKLLLAGRIDFDLLQLQDLTFTAPILTISSQSIASVQRLILTNVTTLALSKGQDYRMLIGSAHIERSAVSSLAHFSIAV